ncbi:MAG: hypothetical protein ABI672_17700 [Vicinamibacteria bacterium]
MNYLIGIVLALLVAAFARLTGFDRDRSFYPTVLIVIASIYVLFAVMGGSTRALAVETMIMTAFATAAVAGFKGSPWLVVAGLAAHGVMDFFHAGIVNNPGVPEYWPGFCGAYDIAAAAALAWIIKARPSSPS